MFDNFMLPALEEAKKAGAKDVPIGAVIVDIKNKQIIGRGFNQTAALNDPTAHAEMIAIRQASQSLGIDRLRDMVIYTTLEPCFMCAHAISLARLRRVYIGARDEQFGALTNNNFYDRKGCNHKPECYFDIMSEECGMLLKNFFQNLR